MTNAAMRIAVVGAGIVGLSVARSLARAGAEVTVFEREPIGAGTSSKTFAWVNSNGKKPESYHALNCAGMKEHAELQRSACSQAQWLELTGTYEWATASHKLEHLLARVASLQSLNYPVETVTRRTMELLFPELKLQPEVETVWNFPTEAVAHTAPLLAWLWSEAKAYRARLLEGTTVVSLAEGQGSASLVLSDGSWWQGEHIVLATGRWTPELTGALGAKIAMLDANRVDKRACGFLAVTNPLCVQLQSNLITPTLNVRPDGGGRLLLQATDLDDQANPHAPAPPTGAIAHEILSRLRGLFENTASARIEQLSVGQRSRPADGLPAVGFLTRRQRVYVAATHSGITLGPLLGRLIAEELVQGHRSALLADYAPDRLVNQQVAGFAPVASTHFPAEQ